MPLVKLPTIGDLQGNREAAIAFAVRCAKRVEPFLRRPNLGVSADQAKSAREAIGHAEAAAGGGDRSAFVYPKVIRMHADQVKLRSSRLAFETVAAAVEASDAGDTDVARTHAIQAAIKAFEAAQAVRRDISSEIREDLLTLTEFCEQDGITEESDSLVYQSVFGPLWPNGVPIGPSWGTAHQRVAAVPSPLPAEAPTPADILSGPQGVKRSDGRNRALTLQEFHRVISERFNEADLKELTRFRLNVRLDHVVSGENFRQTAFQLIEWADQRGRLIDLARAVMAARPGVPDVEAACLRVIESF